MWFLHNMHLSTMWAHVSLSPVSQFIVYKKPVVELEQLASL
jgi:hypothetical protein